MRLAMLLVPMLAFGQVTVRAPGSEATAPLAVRPITRLVSVSCSASVIEPGESTACTATLNQAAGAKGFVFDVGLPANVSGPSQVAIPAAGASAVFVVVATGTASALAPAIHMLVLPRAGLLAAAVDLLEPCCSRPDRCGLAAAQVSRIPCGGAR